MAGRERESGSRWDKYGLGKERGNRLKAENVSPVQSTMHCVQTRSGKGSKPEPKANKRRDTQHNPAVDWGTAVGR